MDMIILLEYLEIAIPAAVKWIQRKVNNSHYQEYTPVHMIQESKNKTNKKLKKESSGCYEVLFPLD